MLFLGIVRIVIKNKKIGQMKNLLDKLVSILSNEEKYTSEGGL